MSRSQKLGAQKVMNVVGCGSTCERVSRNMHVESEHIIGVEGMIIVVKRKGRNKPRRGERLSAVWAKERRCPARDPTNQGLYYLEKAGMCCRRAS